MTNIERYLQRVAKKRQSNSFQFVKASPLPPGMDFTNVSSIRDAMRSFDVANLETLGAAPPQVEELRIEVPLRDGAKVPAWIVRPSSRVASSLSRRPLVVLFHGGGFTLGTEMHMRPYARGLAALFNAVVLTPTYRLAPEFKFPIPVLDAWDILKWTAGNSGLEQLRAEPRDGFIVGGISAGGNCACVLTQLAKERRLDPPLTGQWVCVPLLEPCGDLRSRWFSRQQNSDADLLDTHGQDLLDGYYQADITSHLYSPLNSAQTLEGLPKSYLQICGGDPMRDDGLILARALRDAGVGVKVDIYPGLPHGFWAHIPQLRSSKRFMVDLAEAFSWILRQKVDSDRIGDVLKIR